jgi:hypothetical protein
MYSIPRFYDLVMYLVKSDKEKVLSSKDMF